LNKSFFLEIFFHALEKGHYACPLGKDQALPMIYIDDCVDATIKYLKADQ
jgi:nucleoside-diphosphate-sugar epimerase